VVAIATRADPSTPEGDKELRLKMIKQLRSCQHANACFQREDLPTTFGRFMQTKQHPTLIPHHHQAIKESDAGKFYEARVTEWINQRENGYI